MRTSIALACAALAAAGCAGKPPVAPIACGPEDLSGCFVAEVEVIGIDEVEGDDVKESMVTSEGDHAGLSGLWNRLTGDRARLNPLALERDLERVQRYLRARGHYEADVRAGRVRISGDKARISIVVDEGPPVVVDRREIAWKDAEARPASVEAAAEHAAERVKLGAPVDEKANAEAKEKIERALVDAGYAYAAVTAEVTVDVAAHHAHVAYTVALGPPCTFGPIRLDGTGPFPWGRIRELIGIAPGDPYSRTRIDEAVAALGRLGVFASVEGLPQLSPRGEPRRTEIPAVFRVTPASPRSVRWGLGAEAGSRVEAHVAGGFEHRDLFGQLGRLSLDAKLGLVLYPWSLSTTASEGPVKPLPEARLRADLAQPISLPSQTNALVGGALAMYELLPDDLLGYFEATGKAGVERSFWRSQVHVALVGKLQLDQPFLYPSVTLLTTESGYGPVTVPLVELDGALDLRTNDEGKPDPLSPHRGVYLTSDAQIAGGSTTDVRGRAEMRGYVPIARRWTLALRLGGGLLHAFGGSTLAETDACSAETPACAHFIELLQLRGFQSGGPDSNRGYPYGGVGPHEPVPIPSPSSPPWSQLQGGKLTSTGGSALWEASVELRFPVVGDLGGAVFVDGSDVWRLDLSHTFAPHLSTGFSARYLTPIGPLRLDVGLRIPGAQQWGVSCPVYDPTTAYTGPGNACKSGYLDPAYGQAGTVATLPLAIALSFGESF